MASESSGEALATRPDPADVLGRCRLLASSTREEIHKLAKESYVAFAEAGENLWSACSEAKFTAAPANGAVCLMRGGCHESMPVDIVGPGDMIGDVPVALMAANTFTAKALTNLWYVKVPAAKWLALIATSPKVRDAILADASHRLARSLALASVARNGTAYQRLAGLLIRLSDAFGTGTPLVPISLSRLAEFLGINEPVAWDMLKELEAAGIATVSSSEFCITNRADLEPTLY